MGKALIFAAGEICDHAEAFRAVNPHLNAVIAARDLIDRIEHRANPGRTPEQIKEGRKILNKGLETLSTSLAK